MHSSFLQRSPSDDRLRRQLQSHRLQKGTILNPSCLTWARFENAHPAFVAAFIPKCGTQNCLLRRHRALRANICRNLLGSEGVKIRSSSSQSKSSGSNHENVTNVFLGFICHVLCFCFCVIMDRRNLIVK